MITRRGPRPGREQTVSETIPTDWWRGCVIYQVYPRSYQDTSGDGIGDLRGVIRRLDHIASLGVDAIWLSPFFKSPMADFGYDVADFCDVDPMFGTLSDFDELVELAHARGLKIIIDQVISHSSDQHPWFRESRSSRDNAKADWYIWADPKPDGTAPNNWLSIFGGPAWEWDTVRRQYYMHNFLASQPDLNFHNPDLQNAILDTVRFWLDRGVDGFRLDTVNFYVHDKHLRDNPPLSKNAEDGNFMGVDAPDTNPYGFQDHLYDKSQPENIVFLQRLRALLNEYEGRTTVGEVGDGRRSLKTVAAYTNGGDKLHMCYTFDMLGGEFSAEHFRRSISNFQSVVQDGWVCWAFSNHDVERHVSRWMREGDDAEHLARFAITMLSSFRGSICLYQGEELGTGRSRYRLRGSDRSLRHPVLAGLQGARRLPHADGLGKRRRPCRVFRCAAHLAACSGEPSQAGGRPAGPSQRLAAQPLPPDSGLPEIARQPRRWPDGISRNQWGCACLHQGRRTRAIAVRFQSGPGSRRVDTIFGPSDCRDPQDAGIRAGP
jgi:glycosidase